MAGPAVGSASCPSELRFQSTHSFRDRLRALLLLDALLLAPIEDVPLRAGTVACLSLCVSRDGAPPGIRRGQEVFPEARLQAYGFELSSQGALRYHQGSVDRCIARSHWSVSVAGRPTQPHFLGGRAPPPGIPRASVAPQDRPRTSDSPSLRHLDRVQNGFREECYPRRPRLDEL